MSNENHDETGLFEGLEGSEDHLDLQEIGDNSLDSETASLEEEENENNPTTGNNPMAGNKNAKKKGVGQRKKRNQGKYRQRGGEKQQDPEKRRILKPKLKTASKGIFLTYDYLAV